MFSAQAIRTRLDDTSAGLIINAKQSALDYCAHDYPMHIAWPSILPQHPLVFVSDEVLWLVCFGLARLCVTIIATDRMHARQGRPVRA